MFNKIKEKRYIEKNIKVSVDKMITQISEIRKTSETIMITPLPTGNSWRGIYNGAIAFCPENLLALPQYFSQPIYSDQEYVQICEEIVLQKFQKIIFSGYPPYFRKLVLYLHELKKKHESSLEQLIIYHGSFASNSEDNITTALLKEIFQLNLDGYVQKIGLVKKGMSETLSHVCGLNTYHLIPKTITIKQEIQDNAIPLSGLNIGELTHNQYRKNLHNQVAAALMFENVKVHIKKGGDFDYLLNNKNLVLHDFFDTYDSLLSFIGSMSINFYVTFSECFGLFITESLAMGVPCLSADNSGLFDYDNELKEFLIVKEFDDSNAIYKQASLVLENRDILSSKGIEYVRVLNKIADEKFNKFIND